MSIDDFPNNNYYKDLAFEIINNFKKYYINSFGLISRVFPPEKRTIFDNFDDIVPFFLFFKEHDFLLEQIYILKNISIEEILPYDNLIYSYLIDEYLGGLYLLWKKTNDKTVFKLLTKTLEYIKNKFIIKDNLYGVYDAINRKTVKYTYYWSAGLLETFLEMRNDFPDMFPSIKEIINTWLNNPYFSKYGLFPFRDSKKFYLSIFDYIGKKRNQYISCYPGIESTNIFHDMNKKRVKKRILFYCSTGKYSQIMKANSTFIFTLIKYYTIEESYRYKNAIEKWISNVLEKMVEDDIVHHLFYPPNIKEKKLLTDSMIFIDVLLDFCFFIEKREEYLLIVKNIINRWLKCRWNNGIFPITPDDNISHIDYTLDFAISIRRYGDFTNEIKYKELSKDIINCIIKNFRSEKGYYTKLKKDGSIVGIDKKNYIDPKYNGLFLKGLINNITIKDNIYNNLEFHDLFNDR